MSLCQETYGVLPENVMSGREASTVGFETGFPPFRSSKWLPPTRRETKMPCLPDGRSSDHATHGTVGLPGTSVPAATRGSSASLDGSAFCEQASSATWVAAQAPAPPVVSSTPEPARPTAVQRKPPFA